jgi:hypothetical protein
MYAAIPTIDRRMLRPTRIAIQFTIQSRPSAMIAISLRALLWREYEATSLEGGTS